MNTSTLIKYLFVHQKSFNLKQIYIYNWRYISYFVLWHCISMKYVLHKGRVGGCHRASKSLLLSLTVPLPLFSSVQPVPPLAVGVQFRTWKLMVVYKSFEEISILTDSLGTGRWLIEDACSQMLLKRPAITWQQHFHSFATDLLL